MTDTATRLSGVWGTSAINGQIIAHICPICGSYVTTATSPESGLSGRQAHTAFHIDLDRRTP